jgi:mono/diheme cytochrome c family protein
MRARVAIAIALGLAGCDWSLHRMQEQPRCEPYEPTHYFRNGACNQEPPDGVVSYGSAPAAPAPPVTAALIDRGRDRFERFCAPCHGPLGDGDSAVARDMRLRRPPTLLDARAAALPDEKILTVIDRGYGLMPAYGDVLAPPDRVAVLQFVRVLERREVAADQLTPDLRKEAMSWLP